MRRPVIITLTDLPRRSHRLGDDAVAQVFGGCQKEYQPCKYDWDCCEQRRGTSGSTILKLRCIGFSSGTNRQCRWTAA